MTTPNGTESIHPVAGFGELAATIARPFLLAGYVRPATIAAATGAAVVGGVLFAFSTFVMPALRSLPDEQGMAAMQAINKFAPTPVFMSALFGTPLLACRLRPTRRATTPGRRARLPSGSSGIRSGYGDPTKPARW